MDGHRFDTLVRTVAAARSRRQLVQGLVATGAAALVMRLGVLSTAAQVVSSDAGETCSQDSDCLPANADPCTGAVCDAGSCTYTSVTCIPGYVCCGNGECCPEGKVDSRLDVTSGDAGGFGKSDETHPEGTTTSDPDCAAAQSSD